MIVKSVSNQCQSGVPNNTAHSSELYKLMILTSKTCTIDILYPVIRNQEPFLPPHEYRSTISIRHCQMWLSQLIPHMSKSRKARPVCPILRLSSPPILCQEPMSRTDNLGIEVCREFRPIIGQSTNAQIPAQKRGCKVDILVVVVIMVFQEPIIVRLRQRHTTIVTLTS